MSNVHDAPCPLACAITSSTLPAATHDALSLTLLEEIDINGAAARTA
jgi:hypothetical protein